MKLIKLKAAVLVIVCFAAGRLLADEALPIKNCTWCHGTSGQGYTVAPRLAGQRYQYLENQLLSFKTHARDNPFSAQYMWDAVAFLNPQTARDLAFYFSTIPPKAANDGNFELAPVGRAIYEAGIPDLNIVSCAACHGPNAEGVGAIPRLGGLSFLYLKRKLEQWGEGYHVTAPFPMPQVAVKLPPDTIGALASYLSFVK
jgi:cytochrome c553